MIKKIVTHRKFKFKKIFREKIFLLLLLIMLKFVRTKSVIIILVNFVMELNLLLENHIK